MLVQGHFMLETLSDMSQLLTKESKHLRLTCCIKSQLTQKSSKPAHSTDTVLKTTRSTVNSFYPLY